MSQAGGRTINIADDIDRATVPHPRARIDLHIVADLSRLAPPNLILSEFEQYQGSHPLTDFPLMHLVQTRDLQMEIDEIKKATQHEIWALFNNWPLRSSFHLTIDTYCPETRRMTSQQVCYDNTIEEVINPLHLRTQQGRVKFTAIPNDHWCL